MRMLIAAAAAVISLATAACTPRTSAARGDDAATPGLDSLNARLSDAYHRRDPAAYAALFTDSARFEWPAFTSPRGHAALAAMAKDNWSGEADVELRVRVSARRLSPDHATELGAFEQTWTDTAGVRRTEFGRYASVLAKQRDGSWRIDRWLGFEDSTRDAGRGQRETGGGR